MKTISFFNEKGGVGKSSIAILYASWLRYRHGIKVAVADFNLRIEAYRNMELKEIERNGGPAAADYMQAHPETWPIVTMKVSEKNELLKAGSIAPYAKWAEREIRKGRLKDADVVVFDFPGAFELGYSECSTYGLLNLVAVPIIKDRMVHFATLRTLGLNERLHQKTCAFINRAEMNLNNQVKKYEEFARTIQEKGNCPLLPDVVVASSKMSVFDKVDIIRNTLAYPDYGRPEYEKTGDLGTENLFIDITRELAKIPDIQFGPSAADLSFVEALDKNRFGKRVPSIAYPEY